MGVTRWTSSTLLVSVVALAGCYEGPVEPLGVPWEGLDTEGESDEGSSVGDDTSDPSGGSNNGSNSGGDPTGGDPTGSDPTGGDPTGTDPTGAGETTGGDPTGGDPTDDPTDPTDDSDDPTGDPPPSDEVPDNAYCSDVADWNPAWTQLENQILEIANQRRAEGANCGSAGSFGPAGPLTMNPALRCSSRVHSKDMVDRNFFDHNNPSGESPFQRMGMAGYQYSTAGENIAGGNSTAAATMQQWMGSDGHCANIMNASFTELGVGYYPGGQYGHMWTQNFGSP
jgi:uncharacterized protein YkwD